MSLFSNNEVAFVCGDNAVRCWICDKRECYEVSRIFVYINGKHTDHLTSDGVVAIENFLCENKNTEFEIYVSYAICDSIPLESSYYNDSRSVTVMFSALKCNLEIVLYNCHNGYYKHNFSVTSNGIVVKSGHV